MRGEVKGRLELFRKFIRFGNVLRPLIIGVGARECLEEERECLETGIGREEKAVECLGEEGGCLDTGKGRECWEGAEAGLALRAWVLSEGGGERQEVIISDARKCVLIFF